MPLVLPAFALVLLTFVVGMRMLYVRVREMRIKRVHPQAAATSLQMAAKLEDVRASDNFRNLFETPVLFYALVGVSVGAGFTPGWLVVGAWLYVILRVAHSAIHCTYNRVMHRFVSSPPGSRSWSDSGRPSSSHSSAEDRADG